MLIKIVSKARYELLEKMAQRVDNYIIQIRMLNEEIVDLKLETDELNKKLADREEKYKKVAGKVGGLTANLNKFSKKAKSLEEELKLNNLMLEEKEAEIKILKNLGKKKKIEDYKKLNEIKKDIENKRGKNKK